MSLQFPNPFNVAAHFVDRNIAEGRGDKIAIECVHALEAEPERVTYGELLERVNRTGNALRALGVRMEERVALLLVDSPEFFYSFYATIKIGAVAVPINTLLKPQEWEYTLHDSGARVAI